MTINLQPARSLDSRATAPDFSARLAGGALLAGGACLAGSFFAGGDPDPAAVHEKLWAFGQLLSTAAFLLLAIGSGALARGLAGRAAVFGAVGAAAFTVRFALSTGSHLYQALVIPVLAQHADLQVGAAGGAVNSIYGRWDDPINLILAVLELSLVAGFLLTGRGLRVLAALIAVAAIASALSSPLAFPVQVVALGWLGVRLVAGGSVGPMRPANPTS